VLFAVLVGTLAYYALSHWGVAGMALAAPAAPTLAPCVATFRYGLLHGFAGVVAYLPLIVPFALLTVVGA